MKRIIKITKNIYNSKPIQNKIKNTGSIRYSLDNFLKLYSFDTKSKIYHPDINIYEELKTIEYILKN